MYIYQRRIIDLLYKIIGVVSIILLMVCFSGCEHKQTSVEVDSEIGTENFNLSEQDENKVTSEETMRCIGEKVKELDRDSDMEESVILVNGYPITKKEVETQKIYSEYLKNTTIKEGIESLIRTKAIKAEAERLGMQPSRDKIDTYLQQVNNSLTEKITGTEITFAYMEGMGITQEEYLAMLEETTYDMYQREALWLYVESTQKESDYEKYIDSLVKKADIQILDKEIEKLYKK